MICNPMTHNRVWIRLASSAWLVCLAAGAASAGTNPVGEIAFATTVNRAVADVTSARLGLEGWKLIRLQRLYDRGFATWLEVARQQLLVDTLTEQRQASRELAAFLRALRQRVRRAVEIAGDAGNITGDGVDPSSAGAMDDLLHLVGWLKPGNASSNPVAESLPAPRPAGPDQDRLAGELQRATQRVARAEKRFLAYARLADSANMADRMKHAEWQFVLARAERQLLLVKHHLRRPWQKQQPRVKRGSITLADFKQAGGSGVGRMVSTIVSGLQPVVRNAMLHVAAVEAQAISDGRAAEIALQRLRLRLQAFQQLVAKGHAVSGELRDARNRLTEAQRLVERARERQAIVNGFFDRIRSPADSVDRVRPSRSATEFVATGGEDAIELSSIVSWPLPVLADPVVIRRLIDLRCRYYAAAAQRDVLTRRLTLLKTHLAKLEQPAPVKSPSTSPARAQSNGGNDLRAVLAAGKRRERELLRLDIRYNEARRQAVRQQLQILALEEARLVRQCIPLPDAGHPIEMVRLAYYPWPIRPFFRTLDLLVCTPIRVGTHRSLALRCPAPTWPTGCWYGTGRSFYAQVNACFRSHHGCQPVSDRWRYRFPSHGDTCRLEIRHIGYSASAWSTLRRPPGYQPRSPYFRF